MIKISNLYKGLKGQLPIKRAFRNFFITGNAWGMFSINSHINQNSGKEKVQYGSYESAKKAMSFDKKKFDTRMKENFHYRNGGHLSRKALRLLSKDFRTINHLA